MSRESKLEQIRKQSIHSLNEERLKRLHKEYKNAPFVTEAKKATGASAPGAAAGASGGGGSGLTTSPFEWPGLFTTQFPKDSGSADEDACAGAGGYNKHYYTKSGKAFVGMSGGPNPTGKYEQTFTDPQLTNEVKTSDRIGWNQEKHTAFYFYDRGEFGDQPRWTRKACLA